MPATTRPHDAPPNTRWCSMCRQFRPLEEFTPLKKVSGRPSRLRYYCRPCEIHWQEVRRRRKGIPIRWHPPIGEASTRWCFRCKTFLSLSEFEQTPRTYCLTCLAAKQAARSGGYKIGPLGRKRQIVAGELQCNRCETMKPVSEFYSRRSTPNGYMSWCKTCGREYTKTHRPRHRMGYAVIRQKVLEAYGSRCVCCGIDHPIFLSIDHVNNDGAAHRKTVGSAQLMYWLIQQNFPAGFQILCHNCNRAKYLLGTCPHQTAPANA